MSQKVRLSVIPHTHWDREWYFTSSKSQVYALHDFDELLDTLQENAEIVCFLLDAQTSLIEDYLIHRPEKKASLVNLIKAKRILVGPWYTQSDLLIVSGESILRNLMYGIDYADQLGGSLKVGYAIDCFGQCAQMPQIYNGVGITKSVFKRGLRIEDVPSSEFYWKGAGNSSVFTYHAVDYMNFMNPRQHVEENLDILDRLIKKDIDRSLSKNIILFNGFDQYPIRKDIATLCDDVSSSTHNYEVVIESIEDTLNHIENDGRQYPSYSGELTCGQTGRVHKSIYSSRADIKSKFALVENYLTFIVEPISAIEYLLSGKHESSLIKTMWKLMMESAAHDSIGSCNSDEVNRVIDARIDQVSALSGSLVSLIKRRLANAMNEMNPFQFQIYNMTPFQRSEVVLLKILSPFEKLDLVDSQGRIFQTTTLSAKDVTEALKKTILAKAGINGRYDYREILDCTSLYEVEIEAMLDIVSMGYETFVPLASLRAPYLPEDKKVLENQYYLIKINTNGSLSILHKASQKVYEDCLIIEEGGDDGDSYDYSTPKVDWIINSSLSDISDLTFEHSELKSVAKYNLELLTPSNLEERARLERSEITAFRIEISLKKNDEKIEIKVIVNNKVTEHRVRGLFKSGIQSLMSTADQQFGVINRPTVLNDLSVWKKEKWTEKPRTIEPMQSFVSLLGKQSALSIMTQGTREYQIVGSSLDTIALTLFRTYSFMGKSDLEDRPGRCSGMPWSSPDSELKKEMEFRFALVIQGEDHTLGATNKHSLMYRSQPLVHQELAFFTSKNEFIISIPEMKTVPNRVSLFEQSSDKLGFSILKKMEQGDDLVVRFFGLESTGPCPLTDTNVILKECSMDEKRFVEVSRQSIDQNEIVTYQIQGGLNNE